jgi:uncharacterized protein (DUF488 family)
VRLFTIGFTGKTAEEFFGLLEKSGARRVVDIRRRPSSQLAAFAKASDLPYFLRRIASIDYVHVPELSPTDELLDGLRTKALPWSAYEPAFLKLLAERKVEARLDRELLDGACLLCTEHKPDHCHRRLVVQYLQEKWRDVEVVHLF